MILFTYILGVPTWVFFVSVGIICIIYTSYGGLKAVVWADSLQALIMITGVLSLFFKGASDAGGIVNTFKTAAKYERFSSAGK